MALFFTLVSTTSTAYVEELTVDAPSDQYEIKRFNASMEDRLVITAFEFNPIQNEVINVSLELNDQKIKNWISQNPQKFFNLTVADYRDRIRFYHGQELDSKHIIYEDDKYVARILKPGKFYLTIDTFQSNNTIVETGGECKTVGNVSYLKNQGIEYQEVETCETEPQNSIIKKLREHQEILIPGIIALMFILTIKTMFYPRLTKKSNRDQKLAEINHLTDKVKAHPDKFTDEEKQKIFEANKKASEGELEQAYQIIEEIEQEKK